MNYEPSEAPLAPPATSGKAVASLVLGISSFCIPLVLAIPGIILGIISLNQISRSQGRLKGKGLAIGGIVASVAGTIFMIPVLMVVIVVADAFREKAAEATSQNNLRRIGLAINTYAETHHNMFPYHAICKDDKPLLSWRVEILPYLGENNLYNQFHLDEPWDSPHNIQLLEKMPKVYSNPKDAAKPGYTSYQTFVGTATILGTRGMCVDALEAGEGASNTIMVVEASETVPWTKPQDLPFDPQPWVPLPKLGVGRKTFNVLFADCHVQVLKTGTSDDELRSLIMYRPVPIQPWPPR